MKILELRKNGTNSNGITLVALVISIIVLLILATVTIQTLTGNNGLLTKAETAVQSNKDSQELEKIKFAVAAAQLAGQGSITTDNLNSELRKNFNDNSIEVNKVTVGWTYNGYTIYENGKVENKEILLPKEYQQVEYIESTGTQYIDTMLTFDGTKSIQINADIAITKYSSFDNFFAGVYKRNQTLQRLYFGASNSGYTISYGMLNNVKANENPKLGEKVNYKAICDNGSQQLFINDKLVASNNIEGYYNSDNRQMALFSYFGYNDGQGIETGFGNRVYIFNINVSDLEVRNFIPCYSTTIVTDVDGIERPKDTIGMYDTIEGKFYVNKGSGTFLKGNDV